MDVPWMDIEPVQGTYVWPTFLDNNIAILKEKDAPMLFGFHNSPAWARNTDLPCTLPDSAHINNYIAFILAAIDRYHPQAIEIWNEPESWSDELSGWCCGCVPTPIEYTNVLNQVYTAIKSKHPDIIVVGGALVQGADSDWAVDWFKTNPKMDIVSFHYYAYYYTEMSTPSTAGLSARIAAVQSMTDVPIWLTETSLLCTLDALYCTENFRSLQDIWLQLVYPIEGVEKIFWFTQNEVGWYRCSMLNERRDIVYPVYNSFYFLVSGKRPYSAERAIVLKSAETQKTRKQK